MKNIISIILVVALLALLTACGTAISDVIKVFSQEEYDTLYDKYIASIDVGMIFNSTWDDANNVEPDYYLYYYASSFLRSGGNFELAEDNGMYIPEDELERFVQSHFDVTVEHLRSCDYYMAERNVYEFDGLGSTWHCDITSAEQKGQLLNIQYDVIGSMDYVTARGVLDIEINGEDYKYLSNEYERSAQYYLDYPNGTEEIDNNGVLILDSRRGLTKQQGFDGNVHVYSGQDLSSIIAYYENEALPALEAHGSADTAKYEDGWYWSGTYRGGKPLIIDVQRRYGGETYVIAAAYEADADIGAYRALFDQVDLNNYDKLYVDYLHRLYYSGILDSTWEMAENAGVPGLVAYYAIYAQEGKESNTSESSFPADAVESYVQRYFDISTNMLRGWNIYDAENNAYAFDGFADPSPCDIVDAKQTGDQLILTYEIHRSEDDPVVIWGGELTVELSNSGYQYIANKKYFPKYPITQDATYLDEMTQKYIKWLTPYTGILHYSWPTPQDIKADNLVDICSANNLLNLKRENYEYVDHHGPAAQVEAAIRQRFDVSAEHLRTSSRYQENYTDADSGERYINEYVIGDGGGWGGAVALNAEQDGDLLKITVGLYGPDDEPDRPAKTGLLTIRIDGENYQYLSYELA